MPAIFAWLLGLALKHWHAVADGSLALLVVAVLFFRTPTVVEALLALWLVGHHVPLMAKGLIDRLLAWAGVPVPEDD